MSNKVNISVTTSPKAGKQFSFEEHDTFLFEHLAECHCALPDDKQVSRRHFILEVNPRNNWIRDFGSLNGSYVNAKKIGNRMKGETPEQGQLILFAGMEADVPPATQTVALQPGDRLLLCTDGLWGMLPDAQLRTILAEGDDPEVTCRSLLAAGKQAGGQDNLTAVVCDLFDGAQT